MNLKALTALASSMTVSLAAPAAPAMLNVPIIISGHHDHDGASPGAGGNVDIWHGADDNGSGTVGVVELAHALEHRGGGQPLRRLGPGRPF